MRLRLAVGVAAVAAFVVAGASGMSRANTMMTSVNTRADPGNSVRAASGERDFLPEFLTDPQADKNLNSMTDAVATPALSAPADQLVGEGDGFVDLVVSLSAPGSSTVSVHYATFSSSGRPRCCACRSSTARSSSRSNRSRSTSAQPPTPRSPEQASA